MPNNTDRPFGLDTVKLRAVFVPESEKDQLSRATITHAVGYDAVKIPAVFVAEGEAPPGYPYEHFGRAEFRLDEDNEATRKFTSWPSSSQPSEAAPEDSEPGPTLPRTRYRFGAALLGGHHPGAPPNPTLATRQSDPIRTAIGLLRGIAKVSRSFAGRHATSTPQSTATTVPADAPGNPADTGRQEE